MGTVLSLAGGPTGTIERRAAAASLDIRLAAASTLGLSAGAGLGGHILMGAERYDVRPGWHFTVTYTHRFLDGRGRLPFLLASVSLAASGASSALETRGSPVTAALWAFDARLGVAVGKTFWDVLSPYAALRFMGAPVVWRYHGDTVTGSDPRHMQAAIGLVTALPRGFDVFVEGAPLFERALTIGVGKSF
jgi:hypothetical protein